MLESVAQDEPARSIAHEAVVPFGIGAEIAAVVAREALLGPRRPDRAQSARRPRRRPTPPSLERAWLPDRDDIAAAIRRLAAGLSRRRPVAQQPRARAMTTCWISLVPSPISSTLESQ